MTTKLFVSAILALTLVSCNNTRTKDNLKHETPKALEDKTPLYELRSKRGYDDLVESLYSEELVSKNIDLKKLEDKINELNNSKADTIHLFDEFNEKNQSYFSSANRHVSEIKDSVLRDKMRNILTNNLKKYNSSIVSHNNLLKIIENKELTITDIHNVLKIVKTLPLIEKYQHDNLPSAKSLEGYIKQQDETIELANSLSKK
jgi:predicted transcriptional regulator